MSTEDDEPVEAEEKPKRKRPGRDTLADQRITDAEADEEEAKAEVRETRKKLDQAKDDQITALKEDRDSWRKLAIRMAIGVSGAAVVVVIVFIFAANGLSRGSIKLPGGFGEISLESADEVANDGAEAGVEK